MQYGLQGWHAAFEPTKHAPDEVWASMACLADINEQTDDGVCMDFAGSLFQPDPSLH